MRLLLALALIAGCSDDITPERCVFLCGRDCDALLVEMMPGDRTQLIVSPTSVAAVEVIKEETRARDPEVEVVEPYPRDLYITTDRAGVEYLCTTEDVSFVVEAQLTVVPALVDRSPCVQRQSPRGS